MQHYSNSNTEIKMKRTDLLSKIQANRSNHKKQFDAALNGYQRTVTRWLETRLADIKAGKNYFDIAFNGPIPQDHTRDYDRVIAMFSDDLNEEVVVNEQQYSQYVLDDWGWSAIAITSNSAYLAGGAYHTPAPIPAIAPRPPTQNG